MDSSARWLLAGVLAASLVGASPAYGQFRVGGFANWVTVPEPPPGASEPESIDLFNGVGVAFAGFRSAPPAVSPSYDFRSSVSGPSGGSPRLTMGFSDRGRAELRPVSLTAGMWTHEDGSTDWDTYDGACGYRTQQSYAEVLGCHPGATVSSVTMWNDSGWLYRNFQILVDNITYNGETVSAPADRGDVLGETESGGKAPRVLGNITPVAGEVRVRSAAGGFVSLDQSSEVRVGSVVDATDGVVEISSAPDSLGRTQSGRFSEGVFQVVQSRADKSRGLMKIRLKGGGFRRCQPGRSGAHAPGAARRKLPRKVIRQLRAWKVKGGVQVRARGSSNTAGGTSWVTVDRCDGTLTRVTSGKVVVRDFGLKRTFVVSAGHHHLARIR
jgi:hypothetical protein